MLAHFSRDRTCSGPCSLAHINNTSPQPCPAIEQSPPDSLQRSVGLATGFSPAGGRTACAPATVSLAWGGHIIANCKCHSQVGLCVRLQLKAWRRTDWDIQGYRAGGCAKSRAVAVRREEKPPAVTA